MAMSIVMRNLLVLLKMLIIEIVMPTEPNKTNKYSLKKNSLILAEKIPLIND